MTTTSSITSQSFPIPPCSSCPRQTRECNDHYFQKWWQPLHSYSRRKSSSIYLTSCSLEQSLCLMNWRRLTLSRTVVKDTKIGELAFESQS